MPAPVAIQTELKPNEFGPEQIADFRRNGYAIVRDVAPADLCRRMLQTTLDGLEREVEPIEYEADVQYPGSPKTRSGRGGRTVRRLKQAHARGYAFTEWITQPGVVQPIRQLLGRDVIVPLAHHNCIMTKQPEFSSDTGWHQDIRYWSFSRPELISVWLALGAEHSDNGCLRLIPGSHRTTFEPERFDEAQFFRPDLPENQDLIETAVLAELQAGDALFFHCRTLHSATRNLSTDPKFAVVYTFRPGDNSPVAGTRSAASPELILP